MNHLIVALFTIVILNPYQGLQFFGDDDLIVFEYETNPACVITITEYNSFECIDADGLKYYITYPESNVEIID